MNTLFFEGLGVDGFLKKFKNCRKYLGARYPLTKYVLSRIDET